MGLWQKLFGAGGATERPTLVAHIAFGGAIRVFEVPTDEGWEIAEETREGDGFTVMVVKYVRRAEPSPIALLAKVYTIAPDRAPPAAPRSTDWRVAFGELFRSIDAVDTRDARQLTMTGELEAVEAVIDGTGADPVAPLRIRERRAVQGCEQFLVTALGPPTELEAHAATVDAWFATAAFSPIA